MGMDVCGNQPKNKAGEYFRNTVWWWQPLAEYCIKVAPGICGASSPDDWNEDWHSNSGKGLNAKDARALAEVLQQQLDDGHTASYMRDREAQLKTLCEATGFHRPVSVDGKLPMISLPESPSADYLEAVYLAYYHFDTKNVQDFVTFLKSCGGFKIY